MSSFGYTYGSGDGGGSGDGYGCNHNDGSGYGDGCYGDGGSSGDGYGSRYDPVLTVPEHAAIEAWHYVCEDRTLRYPHDGETVQVEEGLVLHVPAEELKMCEFGLHASRDLEDARSHHDGLACRVEVWGRMIVGDDKICAEYRRVLEVCDE